jgi:ABC-2 type transport system ATP-binding protein
VFLDEPTAALDPEAAFIVREAIETLRRHGRTIVLATHNLDEAERLCDRIAFIRGGLLRVDSPAALRGAIGGRGLSIRLARPATDDLLGAIRDVDGVAAASIDDGLVHVGTEDPESIAPAVVRALVGAGGDIVEVRPERATLERIYFEVMGVDPRADGIEDIV